MAVQIKHYLCDNPLLHSQSGAIGRLAAQLVAVVCNTEGSYAIIVKLIVRDVT